MMYFELLHEWSIRSSVQVHPPGIYSHPSMLGASTISLQASRIWEEKNEEVRYFKDRVSWDRKPDLKEFAWVKLRAKPLEDYR